jgi:hypothetical protein
MEGNPIGFALSSTPKIDELSTFPPDQTKIENSIFSPSLMKAAAQPRRQATQ